MDNIEKLINEAIKEVSEKVLNDSDSKANKIMNDIDFARKPITDTLAHYADSDGIIPKRDINKVLRELDGFDEEFKTIIEEGMEEQAKDSASKVSKVVVGAVIAKIGLSAFDTEDLDVLDEEEFSSSLIEFLRTNKVEGLTVFDRIARYTGMVRDRMQEAIRYGILSGRKFTRITLDVKEAVDRRLSQVKKIITTEIPNVLRKGLLLIGGKLKMVKAIRIIDNRGRHPYHHNHMCYKYAEADKYGMGKGLYKPSDTYILNPHPQCSAYFEYVFDKDKLKGFDDDVK